MEDQVIEQESVNTEEVQKETKQEEPTKTEDNKSHNNKKSKIKISKKTIIIFGIVVIVLVSVYFLRNIFVVATVDGSPISRLTIISKLEKTSGKALLDSIVTEKLIQAEAVSKKVVVSEEDVNSQVKIIEDQIIAQGGTINEALSMQGMSMEDLRKQIMLQKQLEKLIGDKTNVTDQEVDQYIKDNNVTLVSGQEEVIKNQVRTELTGQKFNSEVQALIIDLKAKAKIKYFVEY